MLPLALRGPAAVLACGGALLVLVLGTTFSGQQGYDRLDGRVLADLRSSLAGHLGLLWRIVVLADPPSLVVAAGVLALIACLLGDRRCAVLAVLGPALTGAAVVVLKHLIGRTIGGGLAMPSGHTAGTTALATVAALLVLGRVRPRRPVVAGVAALAGVTTAAAVMAVTMTTLRLHYATDTLGGWGTGLAVTLAVAFAVDALAPRLTVLPRRYRPPGRPRG